MLILVDADLGWWKTPSTFLDFQRRIVEELGLDSTRFIFAIAHTHAGPPLMQPDAAPLPGSEPLRQWMAQLIEATVDTVRQACQTMFPRHARLAYGTVFSGSHARLARSYHNGLLRPQSAIPLRLQSPGKTRSNTIVRSHHRPTGQAAWHAG
jgi:hypothetical protein